MIGFGCPECGKQLKTQDDAAGKQAKCPQCGAMVRIPGPDPPAPAQPTTDRPPATTKAEPKHGTAEPGQDRKPTKQCPFCGEDILAVALKCKHCGEFLDGRLASREAPAAPPHPTPSPGPQRVRTSNEPKFYRDHPAMFRNRPVEFCLLCLGVAVSAVMMLASPGPGALIALIGLLGVFLAWFLKVIGTTLIVTDERVTLRRGILSKHTNEVYHTDIRNVQIQQDFLQRILGVGTLRVSSAGQAGVEIAVSGIPNPGKVRSVIDAFRRQRSQAG